MTEEPALTSGWSAIENLQSLDERNGRIRGHFPQASSIPEANGGDTYLNAGRTE